ncbi:uncharacterized protein LOC129939564 [Eupeodes corollae]|uniref:uncharacterized protein LOC129939564 n=1 Tax=Eupeodes corollae TaxID=290404 RepID=UPI0024901401|nr:uncharacterized protein LOC129939564 [Eupeodes corollae]
MKSTLNIFLIWIFYILLHIVSGKRGFDIVMESLKCTADPKYIGKNDCFIDKSIKQGKANADLEFIHEIPTLTYSLTIDALRGNSEHFTLINLQNADGCAFLEGKLDGNLVKIYRETLIQGGNFPIKCPIVKDYHLELKNIVVDVEKFPPYLPEAKFVIKAQVKMEKVLFLEIELNGTVVQKRKIG